MSRCWDFNSSDTFYYWIFTVYPIQDAYRGTSGGCTETYQRRKRERRGRYDGINTVPDDDDYAGNDRIFFLWFPSRAFIVLEYVYDCWYYPAVCSFGTRLFG